ncbi:hypothetical protein FA15DRAFT_675124 [Coprinopsis marcescibilis]|uniref:Uncharacterized protein n=1 Tax=Coprinopsis marcescibilis TaxID=230819 RepID=A0A5C3KF17_COPMA|nr:hypothetical protein FA15DRAFT_675124 [Coprinopsis marcescibilis]
MRPMYTAVEWGFMVVWWMTSISAADIGTVDNERGFRALGNHLYKAKLALNYKGLGSLISPSPSSSVPARVLPPPQHASPVTRSRPPQSW